MANSVDTQTVRRRSPTHKKDVARKRPTPIAGKPVTRALPDNTSRLSQLYSYCREACVDVSCVRTIAVSALITGALLLSAPAVLAPVGRMLTPAPTALDAADASLDRSARDDPTASSEDFQDNSVVEHRSSVRPATFLISWNQALRCSYALLINGDSHTCQAA
jgi:hypothetical protein